MISLLFAVLQIIHTFEVGVPSDEWISLGSLLRSLYSAVLLDALFSDKLHYYE